MTNTIRQYVEGSAGIGPDTSPHNDGGYHLPRLCSQLTFDGCRPWTVGGGRGRFTVPINCVTIQVIEDKREGEGITVSFVIADDNVYSEE